MATLDDIRAKIPSLQGLSDEMALRYLEQRYRVPAATIARNLGVNMPEPAAPPAPSRSLFAVANDTVISAANAAAGTVGAIGNFIAPGNRFSQGVDEFIKQGEMSQSDAVQQDRAKFRERMQNAQGVGDELSAVGRYIADSPLQMLAEAAGSIAVPGAAIKAAGALGGGVKTGLGIGAAVGGAGAGGDAAGTAYELAKEAGATDEEATAAARSASVIPGIVGAAGGVVGAERLLAGARGFGGGTLSRALKTAGVEGAQEAIEEGITQYEGQRAAVPFDPTIDPMQGVAGAAAMGAALGGAAGGGVSLLSPAPAPDMPPPDKKAEANAALTALGSASTVGEAVALATKATDIPLLPAPTISVGGDGTAQTAEQRQRAAQEEAAARLERAGLRETGAQGQGRNSESTARDFSEWMAQTKAYPIQRAQEMAQIAEQRGIRLEIVPHSSGQGFTLVPAAWVAGQPRSQVSKNPNEGELPPARIEPLPTPDVLEWLEDIPAADAAEVLPVGEASEVLPTGEVIEEPEALPTGEATDIEPEQADEALLLTNDGMPYGTLAGARVRAKREGLPPDAVVEVQGGWAVKKEGAGGPVQPDVSGTAGGTAPAAAGRAPDAVGSGVAVGRVAADARGGQPAATAGTVAGVGEVRAAGDGGQADPALRIKALSEQWADAVARGDAAEARRINDLIVEAKKPPAAPEPDSFEHAGLKVYKTRVRRDGALEDRWAVQLPENRGTGKVGGDTLHTTVEEAKQAAEQEVKRYERAQRDKANAEATEKAQKEAEAARKAQNAGKSIADIRRDAALDRQTSENGEVMTRRQWVERKTAEGLAPSVTQEDKIKPMSRAQFNRATNEEQRAHERRVREAGKKDVYWIGDYEVTKSEHDYAVSLKSPAPIDTSPEPVEKAAASEQVAEAPEPQFSLDTFNWSWRRLADAYSMEQLNTLAAEVRDQFSNRIVDGGPVDERTGLATKEPLTEEGRRMYAALQQAIAVVYNRRKAQRAPESGAAAAPPAEQVSTRTPEPDPVPAPSPATAPAPTNPPTPPEQTRPERLIELRKRQSVLKQLLECLG